MFFKHVLNPCQTRTLPVQTRTICSGSEGCPTFAIFAAIFEQIQMVIWAELVLQVKIYMRVDLHMVGDRQFAGV